MQRIPSAPQACPSAKQGISISSSSSTHWHDCPTLAVCILPSFGAYETLRLFVYPPVLARTPAQIQSVGNMNLSFEDNHLTLFAHAKPSTSYNYCEICCSYTGCLLVGLGHLQNSAFSPLVLVIFWRMGERNVLLLTEDIPEPSFLHSLNLGSMSLVTLASMACFCLPLWVNHLPSPWHVVSESCCVIITPTLMHCISLPSTKSPLQTSLRHCPENAFHLLLPAFPCQTQHLFLYSKILS